MESRKTEIDARINGEIYLERSAPQISSGDQKVSIDRDKEWFTER